MDGFPHEKPKTTPHVTSVTSPASSDKVISICFNCTEIVPNDAEFCPYCAKKLYKDCPQCKHKYSSQYKYCPKCGTNREKFLLDKQMEEEEKRRIEEEKRRIDEERRRKDEERRKLLKAQLLIEDKEISNTDEFKKTVEILNSFHDYLENNWKQRKKVGIILSLISIGVLALGYIIFEHTDVKLNDTYFLCILFSMMAATILFGMGVYALLGTDKYSNENIRKQFTNYLKQSETTQTTRTCLNLINVSDKYIDLLSYEFRKLAIIAYRKTYNVHYYEYLSNIPR